MIVAAVTRPRPHACGRSDLSASSARTAARISGTAFGRERAPPRGSVSGLALTDRLQTRLRLPRTAQLDSVECCTRTILSARLQLDVTL